MVSICMNGNISTSGNLSVGLGFTRGDENCKKVPVLIVMSFRHYKRFPGFRLNTHEYSSYPYEDEYLLEEGVRMYVLKVEEDILKVEQPIIFQDQDEVVHPNFKQGRLRHLAK